MTFRKIDFRHFAGVIEIRRKIKRKNETLNKYVCELVKVYGLRILFNKKCRFFIF